MIGNRNYRIDNVRAISMICIILAHSGAPLLVNNIRSFDVIALVFLSSIVINIDRTCDRASYKTSIIKRMKRLFVPTGIFIVLMTIFQFVIYRIAGRNELLTLKTVINSFLLCENSIGYVWIMKVYFINFVMTPFLMVLAKKLKYIWQYILFVSMWVLIYIGCLTCYDVNIQHSYLTWILINEWLLCCMFYLVIGLDAVYYKMNDMWKKYGIVFWGIAFIGTCFFYKKTMYFSPAMDKRPAGIQYLTYGMVITYILLKLIPNKEIKCFKWISTNSMEIYYIHTFIVFGMSCIQSILNLNSDIFWIIQFFIALVGALCISKCIYIIKLKIEKGEKIK